MIVSMQENASEEQINAVIETMEEAGVNVHRTTGATQTILAGVGPTAHVDLSKFEVLPGVLHVHRISSPYKLAGRAFRPEGTVIEFANGVKVGGERIVAMAGPCSIENREQIFATAARVAAVLNKHFGQVAHADNPALISVVLPPEYAQRSTEFVAEMEALTIEPDSEAVIVVNERTGTIVMGKNVQIAPVAIMQGNLSVEIQTTFEVSQPNALSSGGTTQVVPQTNVAVKQEAARNLMLKEGATVEALVRALSAIGSTPRDIISILQNLKSAGALDAELKVI